MASIELCASSVDALKVALRKDFSDVKSSHLTEALAAGLGRNTHAALITDIAKFAEDPPYQLLDDERFTKRLEELDYPPDPEFTFDLVDCDKIIQTLCPRFYEYDYKTQRARAWRNLMVSAVNEGLRQKLFSLRPGDNRWPGAENDRHRPSDRLFDFVLSCGLPARGHVWDAGFDELSISVVVSPEKKIRDAWAESWLERRNGAWLQTALDQFECRRTVQVVLADMSVRPLGYGDRGRVIM